MLRSPVLRSVGVMTHRTGRTALLAALGLSAALVLASCASTPPAEETAPAPEATADQAPAESTDAAPEESAPAEPQGDGAWLESVAAAIELAESEAGGVAYEIDDEDDDRAWEVHVAVGGDQWEVHVSADGSSVLSSERDDDVDSDDRAALDTAGISLLEAIEAAADEVGEGAVFDDASLEDDDDHGTFAWEVSFDDDLEVYVDVTDGSILHVDR